MKAINVKTVTKARFYYLKLAIIIWLLYFFAAQILPFVKPAKVSQNYMDRSRPTNFYADETGPDRAVLMDDPLKSGLARLKIIANAQESLDIAYYSMDAGESSNLFFAALLEAADRGVRVRLLVDGMFHGIKGDLRPIIYLFILHPNLELKFYEPFNFLLPWTINNRMHDKYIIADKEIGMIGGRNIADKFFAPDWHTRNITHDRDVIIVNTKPGASGSVINEMSRYFEEIWDHKYSKPINKLILRLRRKMAKRKLEELRETFAAAREENKEMLEQPVDFMEISFPTNKISFIHNPLTRLSKEPWCWYELTQLMKGAQEEIFIQSPYVIPSKNMLKHYINESDFEHVKVSILTNSLASTPNFPAFSGYLNHRRKIVDQGIHVFEFQSEDSLHAKALAIDEDLLIVGTFNMDPRSAFLSTESMVVIHSRDGVKQLEEGLLEYIDQSLLVAKNYGYSPAENVEAAPVKPLKRFIISFLSFWARWFEFLL